MQPNWRIHGIIIEGGAKPNIIPDHTKSEYYLRTVTSTDMVYLKDRFLAMVDAAAKATGQYFYNYRLSSSLSLVPGSTR